MNRGPDNRFSWPIFVEEPNPRADPDAMERQSLHFRFSPPMTRQCVNALKRSVAASSLKMLTCAGVSLRRLKPASASSLAKISSCLSSGKSKTCFPDKRGQEKARDRCVKRKGCEEWRSGAEVQLIILNGPRDVVVDAPMSDGNAFRRSGRSRGVDHVGGVLRMQSRCPGQLSAAAQWRANRHRARRWCRDVRGCAGAVPPG